MATLRADIDYQELMIQLKMMQKLVDRKEITTAERKAAKMLMERGRDRLISTLIGNSDHLVDSFTYRLKKGKFAGVLIGFARPGGNVAHLVDMGTQARYTKNKAGRGRIAGSHFWTDTRDQYAPQAMEDIMDAVDSAIRKINGRI